MCYELYRAGPDPQGIFSADELHRVDVCGQRAGEVSGQPEQLGGEVVLVRFAYHTQCRQFVFERALVDIFFAITKKNSRTKV